MSAQDLQVAGLQPLSTVDWPGKLAAVLFLQGCPWRCAYCHNHEILDPRTPGEVPWDEVVDLLSRRRRLLDGVVFSGGEATRQPQLLDAMRQVRQMGFQVGLHTGGAYPARLEQIFDEDLVDWVGFDIKALPKDYDETVSAPNAQNKASQSLQMLLQWASAPIQERRRDYEVRLTLAQGGLEYADQVAQWCTAQGVENFVLQKMQTTGLPESFLQTVDATTFAWSEDQAKTALGAHGFKTLVVRGA